MNNLFKDPLTAMLTIVLGLTGIGLLCYASVMVFSVEMASKVAPFGQREISAWMMGTPQATYNEYEGYGGEPGDLRDSENGDPSQHIPGTSTGIVTVGSKAYDGYVGPASFVCDNLVEDTPNWVTDCFGSYRTETYNHSGLDFGTNYSNGHRVHTPMGGKVTFAGLYGGWGYSIFIENDGYQVLLTHIEELYWEGEIVSPEEMVGKVVEAGDVVMLSGGFHCNAGLDENHRCMGPLEDRDGSSTGPHLHYEVRQCREASDGSQVCDQAVDPNQAFLPGQTDFCDWYGVVSTPQNNTSCSLNR